MRLGIITFEDHEILKQSMLQSCVFTQQFWDEHRFNKKRPLSPFKWVNHQTHVTFLLTPQFRKFKMHCSKSLPKGKWMVGVNFLLKMPIYVPNKIEMEKNSRADWFSKLRLMNFRQIIMTSMTIWSYLQFSSNVFQEISNRTVPERTLEKPEYLIAQLQLT